MIQSASYLVCFGKREREKKKTEKKSKKKSKKKNIERKIKKVGEKKERKKQNSDLSRLNIVPEFGLESVLCTVQ